MTEFSAPIDDRWFEDYPFGAVYEFGDVAVTREEIVEFARQFDPQSFHVDPVAAEAGPFGGLIASGWHTCGLMMRMFAEHYLSSVASLGSPGIDELRWPRPVRPGDRLWLRATVTEARLSRSKPDRGLVRTLVEVFNGDSELVLSGNAVNFLAVRPVGR
ncbi:MaoC family dehydratase [Amycolatopsis ultiminotia]|uniref:MaoC family dehydratase n=1 Tax=Amycolatopsis ultiminotia TaxID=543629 RepID=A0ABP6XUQ4_9PSEU